MEQAGTRPGDGEGGAALPQGHPSPEKREHFVCIRKPDLVDLLCKEPGLSKGEQGRFREVCSILQATFHFKYHATLERLKDDYACFDPDIDTPPRGELSGEERQRRQTEFFDQLNWILARANFTRLSRQDIESVVGRASAWGINLDVDFGCFEQLEVYSRGFVTEHRTLRCLSHWLRLEELDVPIYQRLCVVFRLRPHKRLGPGADTRSIYIKLFKNIPRIDIEMLLPGTRIKMTLLDRLRILVPSAGGVALGLWRLVTCALGIAVASVYGLLALLGAVGGTVGYGLRSFFGYLSTRQKYQLALTRSLYFQNLDNNCGVLCRLLDEAEEQECREAVLGYFLLWRHAGENGWTAQDLNDQAEAFLRQATGRDVDYDVEDALRKFRKLRIVEETPDGIIRPVPIERALEILDEAWNDYFQYSRVPPASLRTPH